MIELPLVFLGGLLGSAHCVGMCGGFAVSIGLGSRVYRPTSGGNWFIRPDGSSRTRSSGSSPATRGSGSPVNPTCGSTPRRALLDRRRAAARSWTARDGHRAAAILAAPARRGIGLPGRNVRRAFSHVDRALSNVLVAGVLTGFLPCGLVYGYLALASSSANIGAGWLTMCLFGAGTAPLMILAGAGGSLFSHRARRNLLRISAICVALTGLISIARGVLFIQLTPAPEVVRCLFCGSSS